MFRTRLSRSSPAISKSNLFLFFFLLPLLDLNSVISKPHYSKSFSTDSPMGPFVGSDDHIVRVVTKNRNGNACRQAPVHWLLASLVVFIILQIFPLTAKKQRHETKQNTSTFCCWSGTAFSTIFLSVLINKLKKNDPLRSLFARQGYWLWAGIIGC